MSFTLVFAFVALLVLILVFVVTLMKKGWKAALIAGGITFVVLAAAFAMTIMVIVNAMNGTPG